MHKLTTERPQPAPYNMNKESGEFLLSCIGELHLEITAYRMQEAGLKLNSANPS